MADAFTKTGRRHVLIVEDDALIADGLALLLEEHDIGVVGPALTLAQALSLVARENRIDGAVLDINLRGEWVYPVAEALQQADIPFVFLTGYGAEQIPSPFGAVACFAKPGDPDKILATLFAERSA